MGCLEEVREDCIKAILNYIQGLARGFVGRMEYKKLIYKRDMIPVMQRYVLNKSPYVIQYETHCPMSGT